MATSCLLLDCRYWWGLTPPPPQLWFFTHAADQPSDLSSLFQGKKKDKEGPEVYCICNAVDDGTRPFIQCDFCDLWCVRMI